MKNKIILAYEKYDPITGSGWNLNGRITPNTTTQIIGPSSAFYDHLYKLLIDSQNNLGMRDDSRIFAYSDKVTSIVMQMQLSDITDQTYFYPVEIRSIDFYLDNTSHIAITPRVLDDIRNGQAYLLIVYDNEGNLAFRKNQLDLLIKPLELPKNRVYVIHGDYECNNFKDQLYYSYKPVNGYPWWLESFKNNNNYLTPITYVPNKLYITYNRRPRTHRLYLISMLKDNKLLEDGFVSFGKVDLTGLYFNDISQENIEFLTAFGGRSIDNIDLDIEVPAIHIDWLSHAKSFLSLVSETLVSDETNCIYFSEKIYKPIVIGHPFLLLGGHKQLAKLREFGFKTFNQWWDEDYDNIHNVLERIKCIINILVDLKSKPIEELILIRKQMLPTLEHNQQVYRELVANNPDKHSRPIREVLESILIQDGNLSISNKVQEIYNMEINTNTNSASKLTLEELLEREEQKMNEQKNDMQKRLEELRKRDPFIYK